jgi:hypothetical protein
MATPRKRKTKDIPPEEAPVSINKVEQNNIDLLIAQSLKRHQDDILLDKKIKVKEMNHLSNVAEEYLNSFILMGFSIQNERVLLYNARTPKDESALMELFRSTFVDFISPEE